MRVSFACTLVLRDQHFGCIHIRASQNSLSHTISRPALNFHRRHAGAPPFRFASKMSNSPLISPSVIGRFGSVCIFDT